MVYALLLLEAHRERAMKTLASRLGVVLAVAFTAVSLVPAEGVACGGCFAPPGAVQVVTDHRMVLSLSSTQSTLWDQFQYSGRPEDFSWILPIRYSDSTRIQLASDDFLTLLFNVMAPVLRRPTPPPFPPGCDPPAEPDAMGGSFADAGVAPPSTQDSGVTVLREEVVGPYAVVVLRGTSGMGLREWLRMNGYSVPAATEPVVDYYLGLGMDFVALRLRAGEGVNRMVPVRVTVDGYQPRLPLRMIAAGVADRVGISLTVVAPSRIEAMNFPNGELSDRDFTYDWNAPVTDLPGAFLSAFNAMNRRQGERLWLTETSLPQGRGQLRSLAERLPQRGGFGDASMPVSSAVDDVDTAFVGLGETATVTRLRADLPAVMLDRDLLLGASDLAERQRTYTFGVEQNRPRYAVCPWPSRDRDAGTTTGVIDAGRDNTTVVMNDGGTVNTSLVQVTAGGGLQCTITAPGLDGLDGQGNRHTGSTGTKTALGFGLALGALAAIGRRKDCAKTKD